METCQQDREESLLDDHTPPDEEPVRRRLVARVLSDEPHHRTYSVPRAAADDEDAPVTASNSPLLSLSCSLPQSSPNILQDVIAGCTVGLMLVPQSMSYARLAGLPVQYGLYAATTAAYAYAATARSTSRLAVGPVAMVSLLLQSGLSGIVNDDDDDELYAALALQTAGAVGVCYIGLGLARAGAVVNWLSHAVVSGFTTAAAVIIMLSQLKYIVGYSGGAPSDRLLPNLWNLWIGRGGIHWGTVVMGVTGTVFLLLLKHVSQAVPKMRWIRAAGPLMITVTALLLTWTLGLNQRGIAVVGEIPSGLPSFTMQKWWSSRTHLWDLLPTILGIVAVGFMESIAIAKQLATKLEYNLDSSRELLSLGCANLASGMFQGYPVAGSFSRSAINSDAASSWSGAITATLVCSALLFLTSVFEMLPLNVLAAIVISGVLGILDFSEAMRLWKSDWKDLSSWMMAFLGTLFLGVEQGLGLAILGSLCTSIMDITKARVVVLGRLPETSHYVDRKQYREETETYDSILTVRIEAPLFFANTGIAWEKIKQASILSTEDLRFVVVDMSSVPFMDGSAVDCLRRAVMSYKSEGVHVYFACFSQSNLKKWTVGGQNELLDANNLFSTVHDAVLHCSRLLQDATSCDEEVLPAASDDQVSNYGSMSRRTGSNIC